jgi:hypothetical protein
LLLNLIALHLSNKNLSPNLTINLTRGVDICKKHLEQS